MYRCVPDAHSFMNFCFIVACRDDLPTRGAERRRTNEVGVPGQRLLAVTCRRVPHPHGLIPARENNLPTLRSERLGPQIGWNGDYILLKIALTKL
jgi:hypothetical protein